MKNNYSTVGACLCLLFTGLNISMGQPGPEFLDCNTTPLSLCVSDDGVRLPVNNKISIGEENPGAIACTVHVTQKTKVRSTCGRNLQYEVQLFLETDTSVAIILQPLTSIAVDSVFEAELSFNSELSPDSIIRLNGIPYTSKCNEYHHIKWIVTDSCGQVAVCEKEIYLYDCFKPFMANSNMLYIIRSNLVGQVFLQLDSILKGPIDDCTFNSALLYSLNPEYYKPDSSFHICTIPAWGVELPFDIWIADKGRDVNCDGIIDWEERNINKQQVLFVFTTNGSIDCGNGDPITISGLVETEFAQPVEKVEVTLASPGHSFPTYITGKDGKYYFSGIGVPRNYTLTAYRNDYHRNGVSTLDIVRIQKHLLGIEAFSSPYDLIAADANHSQSVTAIDMIEIRKLILGVYSEFPHNLSWRFVPKDCIFGDTIHSWPCSETIQFTATGNTVKDLIGIKIGDVNNTVKANAFTIESRTIPSKINWSVSQRNYCKGEIIKIEFFANHHDPIQGFQFTIADPDLEFIDIASGTAMLSEENIALFGDKTTLSWFDVEGIINSDHEPVFTLKVRAKKSGELKNTLTINSDITEAEMYGMDEEIFEPVLQFAEKDNDNSTVLFSPEPNPWKEQTTIPFYLDKAENITLEIYDMNGKLLYTKAGKYEVGENGITITSADINERGILFYSIKSNCNILTNKMIVLD